MTAKWGDTSDRMLRSVAAEPTRHIDATTDDLANAVTGLGRLALAFGLVNRTGVHQLDGTPESDTDHTVMLALVACALAQRLYPELSVGYVAEFALVHDLPEVYAGDTPTLRITSDEREAKRAREDVARRQIAVEFGGVLPWLSETIGEYESGYFAEARFVRAVDKMLPKIVHMFDGARGLRDMGMGYDELREFLDNQRVEIDGYAGEFTELLALRDELAARLLATVKANEHCDRADGYHVVGRWYPNLPPKKLDETDAEYTNRLLGIGHPYPYDHERNRHCSIGWHDSCSNRDGEKCECPCHSGSGDGT